MKRIAALAAFLLVGTGLAAAAGPRALAGRGGDGEVKAVSVVPAPGRVEVVIDLRGAVEVQDFTLSNPARLVIDLTGARLTAPATLYDGQNRGGVKNIRYAQFRPDIVRDRKSTRLNSSHTVISYAVFCLKKKKHKN